ncbi:testis-specific serine/threonine-protein kinase 1-like [Amia ocellicauda]|uniref:testis-specific serine/threonine-protein kinase 1-like n=1 Tax=Amia ocellicauda TaxID=2972642 RepID=UPI003463CDB6
MVDAMVLEKHGYTLGSTLGEGSYAKVKLAYSARLKTNVAVKVVNRNKAPEDFLKRFLPRELEILLVLDHPNIVKTFDIIHTCFARVYVVMELGVQGDLLQWLKHHGALAEDFSRKLFHQLSLAIKYLHDLDIVHRDLKCENLLLDQDLNLKVTDFGFSKRCTYEEGTIRLSNTFCGSAVYAAPEVLRAIPYNPKASDVWSMGVVLYVMVLGSMPYDDSNIKKMVKMQRAHRMRFPKRKPVAPACKDLICRILNPSAASRIGVDGILAHAWLQQGAKTQMDGPSTSVGQTKEEPEGEQVETSQGNKRDKETEDQGNEQDSGKEDKQPLEKAKC